MSSDQLYEIFRNGLTAYIVMVTAIGIIWSAQELREWLVSRDASQLERMKMQHDYALYAQQIMLEQTRLVVELEKMRKPLEP